MGRSDADSSSNKKVVQRGSGDSSATNEKSRVSDSRENSSSRTSGVGSAGSGSSSVERSGERETLSTDGWGDGREIQPR